jgi:hypothetical protein
MKTLTEYEVREINMFGDAIDVNHYDSEAEAMAFALRVSRWLPGPEVVAEYRAVAIAVEKHTSLANRVQGRTGRSTYVLLATFGDPGALKLGGWTT